jgi:ubiquinone/menaquinone biosynthesis C-methylase UbiE
MSRQVYDTGFGGNAADNYERYFVPAIGAPLAADLVDAAALSPGERVLDVACGTGVVTRLAAERVGDTGRVAGSDINPAMLEVARSAAPAGNPIEWHEADAESLPHAEESFDAVLCQMGLQFVANKLAALREMRRVLVPGGRAVLNLPGPAPGPMSAFAAALARHVTAEAASFVHLVFSLYDPNELRDMMSDAGFRDIDVRRATKTLRVPPPEQFMWQYIHSTPMAGLVAEIDERRHTALERDVCTQWQAYGTDDAMTFEVGMTTGIGLK